jgi:hypothetical protein
VIFAAFLAVWGCAGASPNEIVTSLAASHPASLTICTQPMVHSPQLSTNLNSTHSLPISDTPHQESLLAFSSLQATTPQSTSPNEPQRPTTTTTNPNISSTNTSNTQVKQLPPTITFSSTVVNNKLIKQQPASTNTTSTTTNQTKTRRGANVTIKAPGAAFNMSHSLPGSPPPASATTPQPARTASTSSSQQTWSGTTQQELTAPHTHAPQQSPRPHLTNGGGSNNRQQVMGRAPIGAVGSVPVLVHSIGTHQQHHHNHGHHVQHVQAYTCQHMPSDNYKNV